MPEGLVVSLITSIIGGLLVAVVNHLFTARRTTAEADKLRAEAQKVQAETEEIRARTGKLTTAFEKLGASVDYVAPKANELVVYDGTRGMEGYDVDVVRKSKGSRHEFVDGVLAIRRASRSGIYQLQLTKYAYRGQEFGFIPRNELLGGKRRLRVSWDAKVTQGSRTLIFAITAYPEERLLDGGREVKVDQTFWMRTDLYFRVPPHEDCILQIVDLFGSRPGSLQLRNLVLAERCIVGPDDREEYVS